MQVTLREQKLVVKLGKNFESKLWLKSKSSPKVWVMMRHGRLFWHDLQGLSSLDWEQRGNLWLNKMPMGKSRQSQREVVPSWVHCDCHQTLC